MGYISGIVGNAVSQPRLSSSTTTSSSGTTTHTKRGSFLNQFEVNGTLYAFESSHPVPINPGDLVKFRSAAFSKKGVKELRNHNNGYYHGPSPVPLFLVAFLATAFLAAVYFFSVPIPSAAVFYPFGPQAPEELSLYWPWFLVAVAVLLWIVAASVARRKQQVSTIDPGPVGSLAP